MEGFNYNVNEQNLEMNLKTNIKYPFHGTVSNLIDKFLVLGYDQKVIDYTFKNLKSAFLYKTAKI